MSRVIAFFVSEISQLWQVWRAYNPERHYMRGPGPKCREKHAMRGERPMRIATRSEPPMRIDGSDTVVSSR